VLFNNDVRKYKDQGYTESEAKVKTAMAVAIPGTSEHNAGLACDFNSVEESFANTAQSRWLQKHAADYGFIMRYAKDKTPITGIEYEPWHYRYVGEANAKRINELGMCLEEYVDYLKSGKS